MALALSFPAVPERTAFEIITYIVVVSSIGIQGMTLGKLVSAVYWGFRHHLTILAPDFLRLGVDIHFFLRVF